MDKFSEALRDFNENLSVYKQAFREINKGKSMVKKICSNCKHFERSAYDYDRGYCCIGVGCCGEENSEVFDSFGCIWFEKD